MSSDSDPLRDLLSSYESAGERAGEGAFTLDPQRATQMLRDQGRLGQNAFLYLFSAIHAHTDGEPIARTRRSHAWTFEWSSSHGALPDTIELTIAQASFEARGVEMRREARWVKLHSRRLAELYDEVEPRLLYYPFQDSPARVPDTLAENGQLVLTAAQERCGRFVQIVRGVAYPTRWSLPVDALCRDPLARPDLGLNTIPDSARKDLLMAAAEQLLLQTLHRSLEGASPYLLSADLVPSEAPLFATYLHYIVTQTLDPELRCGAIQRVLFPDATGGQWSTQELLDIYVRDKRLMIVDTRPEPTGARSDKPVLLWSGQAEAIGRTLFSSLAHGAGYLYSLAVNEAEKQRLALQGEPRLASRRVRAGTLSLLPWGEPHRTAEVEFIGPRRARETFYLDPEAPMGLRLVWESQESREEDLRQLVLEQPLRQAVLELIDASLSTAPLSRETLKSALGWGLAISPLDWSELPGLLQAPVFEKAGGGFASIAQLRDMSGSVAVLPDLSCSLPRVLPVDPVLWWDPLLQKLGLKIEDVSRLVREANWQQTGRDRWLAAHQPKAPDWPPNARSLGPHLLARSANPSAPTEVAFWREGRPFGRRVLTAQQCPPGFLMMWVEDDLPGDIYWSGPDPAALAHRLPSIAALCADGVA